MIPTFRFLMTISAAILTLGLIGCSRTSTDRSSPSGTTETAAPPATVEHEHASAGPHGGSLIELGEEEFHAEMVHDDKAGNVTIYILDGTAKASSPIEATSLTINLKHEGRGEQFNLAASPDAGDPPGKSSRFVSSEAELVKDLDDEHVEAQLAVSINGKPYNSKIEHQHDH